MFVPSYKIIIYFQITVKNLTFNLLNSHRSSTNNKKDKTKFHLGVIMFDSEHVNN